MLLLESIVGDQNTSLEFGWCSPLSMLMLQVGPGGGSPTKERTLGPLFLAEVSRRQASWSELRKKMWWSRGQLSGRTMVITFDVFLCFHGFWCSF